MIEEDERFFDFIFSCGSIDFEKFVKISHHRSEIKGKEKRRSNDRRVEETNIIRLDKESIVLLELIEKDFRADH